MSQPNSGCRGERISLVEFIIDGCANTHGSAPCTATGAQCYNSFNTCQDRCNYVCQTKSYWFSTCGNVPPHILAQNYTPNIKSISSNPTTLEIGKTFSTRGRIKICFQDIPHNDQGFDPYFPRGAIPIICAEDVPGTLFGRWIERVKYFQNRRVNVYHGYSDQALCDFVKESYFIDSFTGPDNNCEVCFTLKDPLILAEDKNAECPRTDDKIAASQVIGNESPISLFLGANLDGVDTDPDDDEEAKPYAEVGNYLFRNNFLVGNPEQDRCFMRLKHICIGNEVLEVRAEINNATPQGWNLVLVDRGVCGSTIGPHKIGDKIALAETFEQQHVSDVVCRLLTECSEINEIAVNCCEDDPANLINFDSFKDYRCEAPLNYICETIICKPVGVTTLLKELSEQFLFFLYFDSKTGKITIQNLAPPECSKVVDTIELCDIAKNSFSKKTSEDYYNQITYFYDTADCSKGLSEDNLSKASVTISADALRDACERREYKTRKNKKINSRWINECNEYLAKTNGERWLCIRSCSPETVSIDVTYDYGLCVDLGDYRKISHPKLQSIDGRESDALWLLKGKNDNGDCTKLTFEKADYYNLMAPFFDCEAACPPSIIEENLCGDNECIGIW